MDNNKTTQETSDIAALPTIFLSLSQDGDVLYGSNTEEINVMLAIGMLKLAEQKLVAQYFQGVAMEKQKRLATATIVVPRPTR